MQCNGVGNGGGDSKLMVSKASVVMDTGIRPKDSTFQQCSAMAMESTMDEVIARKKKIQGFPSVFRI
jgi:hypothetical protein